MMFGPISNGNGSGGGGGAIQARSANLTLLDSIFTANQAGSGGAVETMDWTGPTGALTVRRCRFTGAPAGCRKRPSLSTLAKETPSGYSTDSTTVGSSSLSYDASLDQYIYVWKTDKTWAGTATCRQLTLKLIDGTYHRANFKFVK